MKVLLVDDLPAIVESLKNGVKWETAGVDKLYTANSAKEAKFILTNFPVDVLVCDIAMPEENGLELVKWVKNNIEEIECIFLTAHAEFDYLMQAMHLGSFDYILQPVKFEDVEKVLLKVKQKIQEKRHYRKLEDITSKTVNQRNQILELILAKHTQGKDEAAVKIWKDYLEVYSYLFESCVVFQIILDIVRWERLTQRRSPEAVKQILENTFINLLEEYSVKVAVTPYGEDNFWILVFAEQGLISNKIWYQKIEEFFRFVEKNMDFSVAVYSILNETEDDFVGIYHQLEIKKDNNQGRTSGIFVEQEIAGEGKGYHPAIKEALRFIEKNISKNLTRTDVANAVNISEEYFSRLFRQETGDTFKDYMVMRKMETAKQLLEDTVLSVSIIASKVGYSNFSHFSQMFRGYVGMSPLEYRKTVKK